MAKVVRLQGHQLSELMQLLDTLYIIMPIIEMDIYIRKKRNDGRGVHMKILSRLLSLLHHV